MRRNSILALALILVVVLAALVYGSARVTQHMQPERGQPTTNAERDGDSDSRASGTGSVPPNARPETPSGGRDAVSNPGGGNAGNLPAGTAR
jgi:hypothetical protein